MSIKIYRAYQMDYQLFDGFLKSFRTWAFETALKVKNSINFEAQEIEKRNAENYADYLKNGIDSIEIWLERNPNKSYHELLIDLFYKSSKKYKRSFTCIDFSLNVYFRKGKFYVIPYGEFLQTFILPKGVKDFPYWDNVDPPDGITSKQWIQRGKIWEELCTDDHESIRLAHEVISFKNDVGINKFLSMFMTDNEVFMTQFYIMSKLNEDDL